MKQVEVRLAFHDWYREGESIYNTNDGLELSLGDYHSGTIFHGSLMLDEENLEELREALKRDALPVFAVFEAKVPTAPVRDAAESWLDRLVIGEIPCRCGESEPPPCRGCQSRSELAALRARVAGLEGELEALRESNLRLAGEVGTECGNLKNALDELTDARALLAVERAALTDALRTWSFDDAQRPTHSWHAREDWIERHPTLRALAQPRAEQSKVPE